MDLLGHIHFLIKAARQNSRRLLLQWAANKTSSEQEEGRVPMKPDLLDSFSNTGSVAGLSDACALQTVDE